jgi:lipid A 4'-phosphatase
MRSEPGSVQDLRRAGNLPIGVGLIALAVWLAISMLLVAFPGIDIEVSRLFCSGKRLFSGHAVGWVKVVRGVFAAIFFASVAATLAGLVLTRGGTRRWLRLRSLQWWYLAVCLAVGPGLVANVGFKNHWGRARPNDIVEFGGKKAFTPALLPTDQCDSNCSFISGEAAAAFVPFYALGVVCPQWAGLLFAAGTVSGLTAGLVRVSQGGHFLSDVVFAGLFMLLTVFVIHLAGFRPRPASERAGAQPRCVPDGAPEPLSERVGRAKQSRPSRRLAAARYLRRARLGERS